MEKKMPGQHLDVYFLAIFEYQTSKELNFSSTILPATIVTISEEWEMW